jgi:two-component system, sensor histidine kinase
VTPRSRLVLVLEDDARAADALALLIEDWGYECVHAAEFDELIPTIEARRSDVRGLITDFHLENGTTGLDAIAGIREMGLDAPVLLLTGTLRGKARRDAAEGGHSFMEKPVAPDRLKRWIDQVALD